jgi:predicted DCC family thiol-disulfide oxidoreductase YuxK
MKNSAKTQHEAFEVFFDGDCPLCRREIDMLRRRDRLGKVRFTDLTQIDWARDAPGKSYADLMARIHGRLPNGQWVEGVEVFRHLYEAAGFGWLMRLSRLAVVRDVLDAAYRLFARNRLRLTGRCDDGACALPRAEGREVTS